MWRFHASNRETWAEYCRSASDLEKGSKNAIGGPISQGIAGREGKTVRNLAIECAGMSPSVGLFEGPELLVAEQLPEQANSTRGLAPLIESLLLSQSGQEKPVEAIYLNIGPGSFTSLRIGLTTAKSLAFAWDIPLVGIDTLEVLASEGFTAAASKAQGEEFCIVPVLNAFRKQVFYSVWRPDGEQFHCLQESCVADASDWIRDPTLGKAEGSRMFVLGGGLCTYQPNANAHVTLLDTPAFDQQLRRIAQLGQQAFEQGNHVSAHGLLPNYVRASAAEEKRRS